jgi:hypothetical protein
LSFKQGILSLPTGGPRKAVGNCLVKEFTAVGKGVTPFWFWTSCGRGKVKPKGAKSEKIKTILA